MQDLGWRRRWGSCPAARRGARQRAGLTPASSSNTLSCLLEMLHSKQLRSIKMLLDSNHGIYRNSYCCTCSRRFMAHRDKPPFSGRPSLTGHCGHGWICSLPRPVVIDTRKPQDGTLKKGLHQPSSRPPALVLIAAP